MFWRFLLEGSVLDDTRRSVTTGTCPTFAFWKTYFSNWQRFSSKISCSIPFLLIFPTSKTFLTFSQRDLTKNVQSRVWEKLPFNTLLRKLAASVDFKKSQGFFSKNRNFFPKKTMKLNVLWIFTVSVVFCGIFATILLKKCHFQKTEFFWPTLCNVNAIGRHWAKKPRILFVWEDDFAPYWKQDWSENNVWWQMYIHVWYY